MNSSNGNGAAAVVPGSVRRPGSRPPLYVAHFEVPHVPWRILPSGRQYPVPGTTLPGLHDQTWTRDPFIVGQGVQRQPFALTEQGRALVLVAGSDDGRGRGELGAVGAVHPGVEHLVDAAAAGEGDRDRRRARALTGLGLGDVVRVRGVVEFGVDESHGGSPFALGLGERGGNGSGRSISKPRALIPN